MNTPALLHFGLDPDVKDLIERGFAGMLIEEIPYTLDALMEERGNVALVISGPPPADISILEVAQTLRTQYAGAQLILVTGKPVSFSKKDLIKNGFNEAYYLPLDAGLLDTDLATMHSVLENKGLALVPVKANDIVDLENLSVPTYIYLPNNGRYVPFSGAGEFTDAKRQKLKDYKISNIYLEQKNLPVFYEAFAAAIKDMQTSDKMSETQKHAVLREIVRDLVSEMFTEAASGMNTGLRLNKHCKDIVNAYISASKNANGWHEKMMTVATGKDDFYNHSSNAMVAATLFGIGLGLEPKNIDALAVAALLQHIGFARLPDKLASKPLEELSPDELQAFRKHPLHALDILKDKKVVLPELAYKVIQQQGERFDGTGFPSALKGPQICPEAQVLNLVNTLIERVSKATTQTNLLEIFQAYRQEYNSNPANRAINPELFGKVAEIFNREVVVQDTEVSSGKWKMG